MDPGGFEHGFQYSLLTFGELDLSMGSAAQQLPAQVPVMPATAALLGPPTMGRQSTPTPTTMGRQSLHTAGTVVMADAGAVLPNATGVLTASRANTMQVGGAMMTTANSSFIAASSMVPTVSSDGLRVAASAIMPAGSSIGASVRSAVLPPPSSTDLFWTQSSTTGGAGGESFNDSGYFSSSQFAALLPRLPAATAASSSSSDGRVVGGSHGQSPSGNQVVVSQVPGGGQGAVSQSPARVARAPDSSTSRSNWQEDFPNISNVSEEWDNSSFFSNFEENLFNMDPSDLNMIMEGVMCSPYKSPLGSPFDSPSRARSAMQAVAASPLRDFPLSNVMLSAVKKSPGQVDNSPFRNLFSTPSPIKGLNPHSRPSPMTRQRRRILQSPTHKPDTLSDQLLGMPNFLSTKMDPSDDLGVTPFHRTNSMGFTPTEGVSASPPFENNLSPSSQPFEFEDFMPSHQSGTSTPTLQEIGNTTHSGRHHKRMRSEWLQSLHDSPTKSALRGSQQGSPVRMSPLRLAQKRISVTRHSHLVDKLDPKGALQFVRARFKEVLEKAAENADNVMEAKLKACGKKLHFLQQPPQMAPAVSQPAPDGGTGSGDSMGGGSTSSVACYTQIVAQRPAARRRQEILPKPSPDWPPQRQPCKIAPKKRKR